MDRVDRPHRIDVRRPATLVNSDGEVVPATIIDISSGGFRLELSQPLREGEQITLQDGGRDMPAEIKWMLGNEAGGVFLAPIEDVR